MVQASDILGMNARIGIFGKKNTQGAKKFAYSKLAGKQLLKKHEIPAPEVLAVFSKPEEVMDFPWENLPESFVIKPEDGNAGKGVWVIRKRAKYAGEWWRVDGSKVNIGDLRLHILDILEGKFSTYDTETRAFIEERVPLVNHFWRYSYKGTPDIRIVVYNMVPVMAMLRLPTKESEGKANLHQGAIGLGVDIATGVTTYGVYHDKLIAKMSVRKSKVLRKVNGLKIPKWKQILRTAITCQQITKLSYLAVDMMLHPTKGVVVLELNANPGLGIQIANKTGLRRRLERTKDLEVRDIEHGIRIGQALFGSRFAGKVQENEEKEIIDNVEEVKIRVAKKNWKPVMAKIDTGAFRSSIDKHLAQELGLLSEEHFLWMGRFASGFGKEKRPVIQVSFYLKKRKIKTAVSVSDRRKMKYKVLIGRKDLEGFLINPATGKKL